MASKRKRKPLKVREPVARYSPHDRHGCAVEFPPPNIREAIAEAARTLHPLTARMKSLACLALGCLGGEKLRSATAPASSLDPWYARTQTHGISGVHARLSECGGEQVKERSDQ